MKRIYLLILCISLAGVAFVSCSDDDVSGESIFNKDIEAPTGFDLWLKENYVDQYNIQVMYKWNDNETSFSYNLVPAYLDYSVQLAKVVKHMWLEAYDEVTGNSDFMRHYVPKQLVFVGSPAVNKDDGSIVLGTAEGGIKVTLYNINSLDITDVNMLNEWYFHTMHHEFAHILHQTKVYPKQEFDAISAGKYSGPSWVNVSLTDAWSKGFVTSYASNEPQEDFVEVISTYIVSTDAEWNNIINNAGSFGSPAIQQKLKIAKDWLKEAWSIDIDHLRSVVRRRSTEINSLF